MFLLLLSYVLEWRVVLRRARSARPEYDIGAKRIFILLAVAATLLAFSKPCLTADSICASMV